MSELGAPLSSTELTDILMNPEFGHRLARLAVALHPANAAPKAGMFVVRRAEGGTGGCSISPNQFSRDWPAESDTLPDGQYRLLLNMGSAPVLMSVHTNIRIPMGEYPSVLPKEVDRLAAIARSEVPRVIGGLVTIRTEDSENRAGGESLWLHLFGVDGNTDPNKPLGNPLVSLPYMVKRTAEGRRIRGITAAPHELNRLEINSQVARLTL